MHVQLFVYCFNLAVVTMLSEGLDCSVSVNGCKLVQSVSN